MLKQQACQDCGGIKGHQLRKVLKIKRREGIKQQVSIAIIQYKLYMRLTQVSFFQLHLMWKETRSYSLADHKRWSNWIRQQPLERTVVLDNYKFYPVIIGYYMPTWEPHQLHSLNDGETPKNIWWICTKSQNLILLTRTRIHHLSPWSIHWAFPKKCSKQTMYL